MATLKAKCTVAELMKELDKYPGHAVVDVYGDYMQAGYLTVNDETVLEGW